MLTGEKSRTYTDDRRADLSKAETQRFQFRVRRALTVDGK